MPPDEMSPTQKDMGRMEGRLQYTLDELNKVARHLTGNGQPGILDRLTRTEESVKKTAENVETLTDGIAAIKESLERLSHLVEAHQTNQELHSVRMFLKKDLLVWILISFIMVHTILENGGDVYVILLKILGL